MQAGYGWCVDAIKNAKDPAGLVGISMGVFNFDSWYGAHGSACAHAHDSAREMLLVRAAAGALPAPAALFVRAYLPTSSRARSGMCTDRTLPNHTRRLHVHRSEGMSNKYSVRTELYDCFTLTANTDSYKVLPVWR